MKKIFFVAIAAMMLTVSANAQSNTSDGKDKPDMSEMIQKRTDQMVSTYGLDSKQAEKLLELNKKYADSMPPMGGGPRPGAGDSSSSDGDRPAPPQRDGQDDGQGGGRPPRPDSSQMEAYNTELKAIIGDENYSKYETEMKNHMNRRGERPQE